jgi:hypothetical protein
LAVNETSQPQNMKYKILLFLIVLIGIPSFGQKKYLFDYMMEYYRKDTDTSKVKKEYILTNSKDNSYTLTLYEKDSLNFNLFFLDQNGIYSKSILDKKSFSRAEFVTLNCGVVSGYGNPYKYQTKNYDFINKSDTIIDGQHYFHYFFKSNKPKKEKRKKLATEHFIVEKNTSFHLPILTFATSYEEWKLEKNIPNGIPKQMYMVTYKEKELFLFYELKRYAKINKYIIIPEECDYTNSEITKKRSSLIILTKENLRSEPLIFSF